MSQTTTLILLPQTHYNGQTPPASGIASIYQDVLTITSVNKGVFGIGQILTGNGVTSGTTIVARVTGAGGVGTYTVTPGITNTPTTIVSTSGLSKSYPVIGERKPAAAYYLGNKDLQTINISTTTLTGNVIVEASLYTEPSDGAHEASDWFTVYKLVANAAAVSGSPEQLASTASIGANINGNFVWIRARIEDFSFGTLNWVKVTY
jgi:hypothetical protein